MKSEAIEPECPQPFTSTSAHNHLFCTALINLPTPTRASNAVRDNGLWKKRLVMYTKVGLLHDHTIRSPLLHCTHPLTPSPQPTEVGLAKHYMEDDRFEDVQELCAKAQGVQAQAVGDNHPLIATTLMLWGQACRAVGKLDEVRSWRQRLRVGVVWVSWSGYYLTLQSPSQQALAKFTRVLDIRLGIYKTISNQVDCTHISTSTPSYTHTHTHTQ